MSELFQIALHYISIISIFDVLDVAIVSYALYKTMRVIRGSAAWAGVKGIMFLIVLQQVSRLVGLNIINYILRNTLQLGFIAIVVMFQPELRKMLEKFGRGKFVSLFDREAKPDDLRLMITEVVDAASTMSWSRTGALIVFERRDKIDELITVGTKLDAKVSSELIRNIFFVKAPLHDGAMVVTGDRIVSAGCVLPLSENDSLSKDLGTRHRAGIGISEMSDVLSLIVSEETGTISVAIKGRIKRGLSPEALESLLIEELMPKENEEDNDIKKRFFSNLTKWKEKSK